MRDLLSIGAFSQACRLSIKSLRRYDQQGLLPPAWVDPDTGYRYYRPVQVVEAERIRLLRELDLPLAEIRCLQQQPERAAEILAAHQARLEARIAAQQHALARLQALQGVSLTPHTVRVQACEPVEALSIRLETRLDALVGSIGAHFGQIGRLIAQRGAGPAGVPFIRYHGEEYDPDKLDVELGIPCPRRLRGAGEVRALRLPAGAAAVTLHVGPYEQIGRAYAALMSWARAEGRALTGPPLERYLHGPRQRVPPADYRTEICWMLA